MSEDARGDLAGSESDVQADGGSGRCETNAYRLIGFD
jgi:hypothetical protein